MLADTVELAEEKSQSLHSQKPPRWAQKMYVTKWKKRYSECNKKVLYAGPKLARNVLINLSLNLTRTKKPGPTYNSSPRCVQRRLSNFALHTPERKCLFTFSYVFRQDICLDWVQFLCLCSTFSPLTLIVWCFQQISIFLPLCEASTWRQLNADSCWCLVSVMVPLHYRLHAPTNLCISISVSLCSFN